MNDSGLEKKTVKLNQYRYHDTTRDYTHGDYHEEYGNHKEKEISIYVCKICGERVNVFHDKQAEETRYTCYKCRSIKIVKNGQIKKINM